MNYFNRVSGCDYGFMDIVQVFFLTFRVAALSMLVVVAVLAAIL